jgi:hypothetical protein
LELSAPETARDIGIFSVAEHPGPHVATPAWKGQQPQPAVTSIVTAQCQPPLKSANYG